MNAKQFELFTSYLNRYKSFTTSKFLNLLKILITVEKMNKLQFVKEMNKLSLINFKEKSEFFKLSIIFYNDVINYNYFF